MAMTEHPFKTMLRKLHLSQHEAAVVLDTSQSTISKFIRGVYPRVPRTWYDGLALLKIDPVELNELHAAWRDELAEHILKRIGAIKEPK